MAWANSERESLTESYTTVGHLVGPVHEWRNAYRIFSHFLQTPVRRPPTVAGWTTRPTSVCSRFRAWWRTCCARSWARGGSTTSISPRMGCGDATPLARGIGGSEDEFGGTGGAVAGAVALGGTPGAASRRLGAGLPSSAHLARSLGGATVPRRGGDGRCRRCWEPRLAARMRASGPPAFPPQPPGASPERYSR